METANENNDALEVDTSVVDGGDAVDSDDEGVPDDILASIEGLRDEENEVLDSHLADNDATVEETEEVVEESVEEAVAETEEAADDDERKDAIAHLLTKNLTMEQIEKIEQADPSIVLALASSHGWKPGDESSGETPEGATEETTEEVAEESAFDESAIVEAIVGGLQEDLGDSFDDEESSALSKATSKAIAKAVGMIYGKSSGNDAVTQQLAQQANMIGVLTQHYENTIIDAELPKLVEIYPGLSDEGGRDRLVKRAMELADQGVKTNSPQELLRNAAVIEFGAAAASQHKELSKKIARSKVSGQPTGKAGGNDTTQNSDKGLAAVKDWMGTNA